MDEQKMISGKTSSGFYFTVDKDATNDMELLEDLVRLDSGDVAVLPEVLEKLVGATQKKDLYNHVRNESGRVPMEPLMTEIKEIFEACKQIKN